MNNGIFRALRSNKLDEFKKLVTSSNVNSVRIDGFTVLMLVIVFKGIDKFDYLLSIGANVNAKSEKHQYGPKFDRKYALDNHGDMIRIVLNDEGGMYPLELAINNSLGFAKIKKLIDLGADINQLDHDGFNALHLAIMNYHNENSDDLITLLLKTSTSPRTYINTLSDNKISPLTMAIRRNRLSVINILFANGAKLTTDECAAAYISSNADVKKYFETKCNDVYNAEDKVLDKVLVKVRDNNILNIIGSFIRFGKKNNQRNNHKKERIVKITKSKVNGKKYAAIVKNIITKKTRTINFGAKGYQQYRDSTKLKAYKSKNHGDAKRRKLYFTRHSGLPTKQLAIKKEWKKSKGMYNPKILSHTYLW
jgi:ankyrin repeat protein